MEKNFDHKKYEADLYNQWDKSGAFVAPMASEAIERGQSPFCVIMPPPNANDPLHVGHACFVTIEDIFTRYHRMKGEATMWLPGTDHAGIETQFVFEKKLAKEGKSRFDYGREELYQMISSYVSGNSNVAIDQMKKLGASADWSRFKFTLDKDIVDEVKKTFFKLCKDGLVYRGERLVNYCTKCGTGYSELEVEYEERDSFLYIIDYGSGIKVATTRPETMLGDVAVAVNPNDARYKSIVGKKIKLPLNDREIEIVEDEMVDMEFGTGAVKITPAHDPNDWAVAERKGWNLGEIVRDHQVIGKNGKLNENAGKYAGLSVLVAREQIIADLGDLLVEKKPYKHSVGTCYRCHREIEPLPLKQFFIKTKPLAQKALAALESGETVIHGAGRDKILKHWLENVRDWNISRQIVWGIKIPAWIKGEEFVASEECPGEGWVAETDTFDTWFSSGQWPVVTLKSNKKGDFDYYYPTTIMETAYDILPIWVMRMMMLGIYMTGKSPFKHVYLHGLVRDNKGRKMSKSVGNVVNPIDLIEKYGADALRIALVMSTTAGNDSSVGEDKVRGMRNFANKIWNAARYVLENEKSTQTEEDEVFRTHLDEVVTNCTRLLEDLKVGLYAETVHNEFWHWYCDEIIEKHKRGEISNSQLKVGLETFLKLLHPVMPFVTEAVWAAMQGGKTSLVQNRWPETKIVG